MWTGAKGIVDRMIITQKIASTKGTSENTSQFAVTVVGGSGNWQVNDIEPASAGNF